MTKDTNARGIILAGGKGSRLFPLTQHTSKQLLPVYDKPLIYYPLATLLGLKVSQVDIIVTSNSLDSFKKLLGDGSEFGVNINYHIQDDPNGIAEVFKIIPMSRQYTRNILILGDNIFFGSGLEKIFNSSINTYKNQNFIFTVINKNPKAFGVPVFNKKGKVINLVEKPKKPKNNQVIPGIYIYGNEVFEIVKKLKPSLRGELEITDLNKNLLNKGKLKVRQMPSKTVWFDAGTQSELLSASNFISSIQGAQNELIGSPHLNSFTTNKIDLKKLKQIAKKYNQSNYGSLLNFFIEEKY